MPDSEFKLESYANASNYKAQRRRNDCSLNAPEFTPKSRRSKTRKACDDSLLTFLETCFPNVFTMGWSPDHEKVIADIQRHIIHGGLKAIGMPRGTGKTSIMLRAAIWAILTGRRRFVCLVAADEYSAISNLDTIKTEINWNDKIIELYPYETWCIRHLQGEGRRANGQHFDGKPTAVEYGQRTLCFGTLKHSITSGSVITTAGITGRIRGQQFTTMAGDVIRPDFVLCDDPQTKISAASPSQCLKRHETMMGDVLGLSGPGVKISGFATCTVIYQDDLADRLLDHTFSGEWNGSKVSMIQSWPTNMKLWDEYNTYRIQEITEGDSSHSRSRQFVKEHYEDMHSGATVYWEDRKSPGDVSALQHAMDLYYRDPAVFASEFQNKPMALVEKAPYEINIEELSRRVTALPRGRVPDDVHKITAFIDVQRELLYYVIVAWTVGGRAYIIDYGSCPDQKRHHWNKANIAYTLPQVYGDDFETFLIGGLEWLTSAILDNQYTTESGAEVNVNMLAIDSRWGESTHIIRRFCRYSKNRSRMHPSMGVFIGANSKPWQRLHVAEKDKRKVGVHAKLQAPKEGGRRELYYDTNYWKSFVADRLLCLPSSPKAMMLFDEQPHVHRMFAEHCAWEEPLRVIGKANNEVVEWTQKNIGGTIENDFWDCLVGNAALASTIGVETHSGNRKASSTRGVLLSKVMRSKNPDHFFRNK